MAVRGNALHFGIELIKTEECARVGTGERRREHTLPAK